MPTEVFDNSQIRLERVQTDVGYHAAYNFWTLRGVLAERWGHGPLFGGYSETQDAIVLTPAVAPDTTGPPRRIQAVYGLRAAGVNGEGAEGVEDALSISDDWIADVFEVLRPKRAVRVAVVLFFLYPVTNAAQASRNLRGKFYRPSAVEGILPSGLLKHRDRYHSAVDMIVPLDDNGSFVSVVIGAVGPLHQGQFFATPDPERDRSWFLGMRYHAQHLDPDGFSDAPAVLKRTLESHLSDATGMFGRSLEEIYA
jgi:hypothetical protein